ncbi:MAG: hypothetical protein VYB74_06545, partial [Cyanobacteriota bacterium]|nr:hypothetical protein [Cyanobacteriota bacterium]
TPTRPEPHADPHQVAERPWVTSGGSVTAGTVANQHHTTLPLTQSLKLHMCGVVMQQGVVHHT